MSLLSSVSVPFLSFFNNIESNVAPCSKKQPVCLPLAYFSDFQFQFQVSHMPALSHDWERRVYVVAGKGICQDAPPVYELVMDIGIIPLTDNPGLEALWLTENAGVTWPALNAVLGSHAINVGDCLRLYLIEEIRNQHGVLQEFHTHACSRCFQRINGSDSCFLSNIEYSCNENAFGFIFKDTGIVTGPGSVEERAKLPFFLKQPQFINDQDLFTLSDQSSVKLFEVIKEEWELETQPLTFELHRRLNAALSHDTVVITGPNIEELISAAPYGYYLFLLKDDYKLKWQKHPSLLAKAEARMLAANPVNMRNLNCG